MNERQVAFIIKAVQVIDAVLTFEAFKELNCVGKFLKAYLVLNFFV